MTSNAVKPIEEASSLEGALTPPEIVKELNRFIIAQKDAKKAVALALRNRARRMRTSDLMRDEIAPKNIIMVGPTGVGKTEISRRLAKLCKAPFVKVEASKFTEVGYVGRDVESLVRDIADASLNLVKEEEREIVLNEAKRIAEEKLLSALLPGSDEENGTRDKLRQMLQEGKLEDRQIEIEVTKPPTGQIEILGPPGFSEMESQLKDMFSQMTPKKKDRRQMSVSKAREALIAESQEELLDNDSLAAKAVDRVEQGGIVFIDEIDKICGSSNSNKGPDVSREGVQRDLLPIVEGCTVNTKYGPVKTNHILFIASGAFHTSSPSDLMPEFQGRFPIRVELESLTAEHFVRILTEPAAALTKQYQALLETEGVELIFTDDAIRELATLTEEANAKMENIGARRLHTIMEKLLEEVSFEAHELSGTKFEITRAYVKDKLEGIVSNEDLSKFIL